MARYLVTGGAGFIGSHMARALVARGDEVVVIDNLSSGLRRNIPEGAVFVEADLAIPSALQRLPRGRYEGVLHFAAQSAGAVGQSNPHGDVIANVGATVSLSRWALAQGVGRFLFSSSMLVYGHDAASGPDETSATSPASYYGVSKRAAEEYLRLAAGEGLGVTIFRIFNAYGPAQNLDNRLQGMVSIYLAYLLDGVPVPVTGSLDRFRDFIFIDDVVAAFLGALDRPSPSLVYNLGVGRSHRVRDVLAMLIRGLGLSDDFPIREGEGSPHDAFGSVANIRRIRSELGWEPTVDLEHGIARMIAWARTEQAKPRHAGATD